MNDVSECSVDNEPSRGEQHMMTGSQTMGTNGLTPSRVGVLLLDAHLRLVHYNAEAACILGYPRKASQPSLEAVLPATRTQLSASSNLPAPAAIEVPSGRRRYSCRAFMLDVTGSPDGRLQPRVVVVLERVFKSPVDLSQWGDKYQLTHRERETVQFLLKGLTSKEIADAMSISPNTVKSFLKLVMAKVGASNRTGIVARVLERAS
jgi:two-component system response regulator DesR